MIVNIDGQFVAPEEALLPVDDGAILFGDTLFETMKGRDGTLPFIEEHLDRIEGAARMLAFPFSRTRTQESLQATAARLEAPVCRLRLTVSRGSFTGVAFPAPDCGRTVITAIPYREPSEEERASGIDCLFAPNRRVNPLSHLPQMKRGSYADCLYAANFARSRGAREALFVTGDGWLLEGATSNLFLRRERTLVTPTAGELVLAGIMRRQVLNVAERLGFTVEERAVAVAELFDADEVFITNALIDLLPVATVEGRPLRRGSVSAHLLETLRPLHSTGRQKR